MVNSRAKGKNGELEAVKMLKAHGYKDVRRSQQFAGMNGDADVVGLPKIHLEIKRVERLNIYDAMAQSVHDAREGETPVVMHRRNNCEWLVTMRFDDWIELYKESGRDG